MTAPRDPDQLIHHFLLEGSERLHDQVYDAVRRDIERTRQRPGLGLWRLPTVNKILPVGLGAAAVLAILVVGTQLLPPGSGLGAVPSVEPSVMPSTSLAPTLDATPSPIVWTGLPAGPFVATGEDDPVEVTLDIATRDWVAMPDFDAVGKNDDGLDPPETVGAALLAWAYPSGTGFNVYGDPCQWLTTLPETPATTPDEIAAALATQASRDATTPTDVTVGGYAGKAVTLTVPMSYEVPGASREEEFAECDQDTFASFGLEGRESEHERNHQGPGQIDEFWIVDVDGAIVIFDAMYGPAVPDELVEEMRALVESATFE